jgi:hypothetical protein
MGFNITLFACGIGSRDALLAAFSLGLTDIEDEINEAPFSAGISGEHFVIWQNTSQSSDITLAKLIAVSRAVCFLKLDISETAMACVMAEYRGGTEEWVACCDAGQGQSVELSGKVPERVKSFVQSHQLFGTEDEFEILPDAFKDLTGFRYDELSDGRQFFQALEGQQHKPWWQFW